MEQDLSLHPHCVECGVALPGSHIHRKYCSARCKGRHRKKHGPPNGVAFHNCRECGAQIPLAPGQGNKWICSDKCRRAATARSAREFHKRRPAQEAIYRARTKAKVPPDGALLRFYRWNPNAPRGCECCGEARVVEVAHKPEHARLGQRRSRANCQWPDMVWVLCPTCHRLLDRMNYSPAELGLK